MRYQREDERGPEERRVERELDEEEDRLFVQTIAASEATAAYKIIM